MEHFASSVFFLFDDYFQMAIDDWLEFKLKQSFQDQLLLLTDYSDPNQSIEYDLLIKEYSEKFQPESDKRIGDFFSIHTMRTFFLVQKRIEPVFINQRIKQLKYLIRQIDSLLKSKQWFSIPSNYQSSFLQPELLNNYMDIYIFMFPFLQWVSHWITFLELNYNHDDRVKRLVQRLKNDIRHTSEIYTVFKQKSANQFIDYITMTNL